MGKRDGTPRVLVVDDEPDLVQFYEVTLGGTYDVRSAHGGVEAVAAIEEAGDFDVALIDRRMPDVTGDAVLEHLAEATPSCRVAMVTAVEPDFDVLEMPFDEYIVKPVTRDVVRDTVERLLSLTDFREQCQEEYAVASKVAALRAHKDPAELERSQEYRELLRRLDELRDQLDDTTARFETAQFAAAFAEIGGGPQASQSD